MKKKSQKSNRKKLTKEMRVLSGGVKNIARTNNRQFAQLGSVPRKYGIRYVDIENGLYGVEDLIVRIFKSARAVLPDGFEMTNRGAAVARSLYFQDIVRRVHSEVEFVYPLQTIKNYIFIYLSGKIGRIQLSNAEDDTRQCPKPRSKYYLIEQPK